MEPRRKKRTDADGRHLHWRFDKNVTSIVAIFSFLFCSLTADGSVTNGMNADAFAPENGVSFVAIFLPIATEPSVPFFLSKENSVKEKKKEKAHQNEDCKKKELKEDDWNQLEEIKRKGEDADTLRSRSENRKKCTKIKKKQERKEQKRKKTFNTNGLR